MGDVVEVIVDDVTTAVVVVVMLETVDVVIDDVVIGVTMVLDSFLRETGIQGLKGLGVFSAVSSWLTVVCSEIGSNRLFFNGVAMTLVS